MANVCCRHQNDLLMSACTVTDTSSVHFNQFFSIGFVNSPLSDFTKIGPVEPNRYMGVDTLE